MIFVLKVHSCSIVAPDMPCIIIKFGFRKFKYAVNGTVISKLLIKKGVLYSAKNYVILVTNK